MANQRRAAKFREVMRARVEGLEARALLTVSIAPIAPINVPALKTVNIPVSSVDSAGGAISYTVDSSNPNVSAYVRSGTEFLKLSVSNFGDLVFQLYDDVAPNTVARVVKLVNQHYYDGLSLNSLAAGLLGTASGTGAAGSAIAPEFDASTIFDGSGQLAVDNISGNATGGSFFVTLGPERKHDFNDTIFGQLVSGQGVLAAVGKNSASATIQSASIVTNNTDSVIQIQAPAGTGTSNITLTATTDSGATATTNFTANFAPDIYNDPPFLAHISDDFTFVNSVYTNYFGATDLQSDPIVYTATETGGQGNATVQIGDDGTLTVIPNPGFTGVIPIEVTAAAKGAKSRGVVADPRSIQTFNLTVMPLSVTTTAMPVTATTGVMETHLYGTLSSSLPGFSDVQGYLSVTVDFGDGTTGQASLVPSTTGQADIVATHSYATAGNYVTSLMVTGPGTFTETTASSTTAVAANAYPLTIGIVSGGVDFGTGMGLTNQSVVSNQVVVTNNGKSTITNVVLTATIPPGFTYASNSAKIIPIATSATSVLLGLGDIPAGGSVTITITLNTDQFGGYAEEFSASGDNGAALTQTVAAFSGPLIEGGVTGPKPVQTLGHGKFTNQTHWVKAASHVSAHAITLTSREFAAITTGRKGLTAIFQQFNRNGNVHALNIGLAKLVTHIPYGAKKLSPSLKHLIASAGLSKTHRDPKGVVMSQVKNAIVTYLNNHVGVDINVVKSRGHAAVGKHLKVNGKV